MTKIGITETVLADAVRPPLPLAGFEPILEAMGSAGYRSIECWSGAVFDGCLRYLGEDPWERLRAIKRRTLQTPLQMQIRGQALFGYRHYPDDVVRAFVRRAVQCGVGIIRVADMLNDLRNSETAIDEALRAGAHVSGTLCYAASPAHSLDAFMALAKKLAQMGCHSVCIEDSEGIMGPQECYELVRAVKQSSGLAVSVSVRGAAGLGPFAAMKAIEAGADSICCVTSCFSNAGGRPATESMSYALSRMGFDSGLNMAALGKINGFFRRAGQRPACGAGHGRCETGIDSEALIYRLPGSMLAGLRAGLLAQGAPERLPHAVAEAQLVHRDFGYPPLVPPISGLISGQAVANVLCGERYKSVSKEVRAYLAGEYGKPPGEVDREMVRRELAGRAPAACRFADILEPGLEKARAEIAHLSRSVDDVLSYALFPQIAESFFERRDRNIALR